MKRKILTVLSIMAITLQFSQLKAQTTLFMDENGNPANTDLASEFNVSVGDQATPDARIHIFNGIYRDTDVETLGERPFLITGYKQTILRYTVPSGPPYSSPPEPIWSFPILQNFFTVDFNGNVGINVLDPFTKLHLHDGIFTITDGDELAEPSANWQIHGTENAFAIKDHLDERYRFWIKKSNGNVGIGTTDPDEKLEVEGNVLVNGDIIIDNGALIIKGNNSSTDGDNEIKLNSDGYIRAREIKVDLDDIPHPDYVFKADYNLMPLEELKIFIKANKHLPNVKSEAEFNEEGSYSLGEMNLKLLEKVEELTLYILDLQAQVDELKSFNK